MVGECWKLVRASNPQRVSDWILMCSCTLTCTYASVQYGQGRGAGNSELRF